MIKVLLRESALTALAMLSVSLGGFCAMDLTLRPDWFGVVGFASATHAPTDALLGRHLPLVWNPDPLDAAGRTRRDLDALARDVPAAQVRIAARGTAGLPTILPRLAAMPTAQRRRVLNALARIEAGVSASDPPPAPGADGDLAPAARHWERYDAAHGLDFRESYASRQAARLLERESANASERVARLGTYALPSLMRALGETSDRAAQARVVNALADLTGLALHLPDAPSAAEARFAVEAWRAWWFVNHAEYTTLGPWQRSLARAFETRYGQWLSRALRGHLGVCAVTRRSVATELRARVTVSALTSGVGGLLGVGVAIGFGGGAALRARRLRARLLDLLGAVLPGLLALIAGWVALLRLLNPDASVSATVAGLFDAEHAARTIAASVACAALPSAWLLRPRAPPFLDAVRIEAEAWTLQGRSPSVGRALRHVARIAAASLLAPLALAAPLVLSASMIVESALRVQGMGALTAHAATAGDGAWLLVAALTVVPVLLARRWASLALVWLLGTRPDGRVRRLRSSTLPPPDRPGP